MPRIFAAVGCMVLAFSAMAQRKDTIPLLPDHYKARVAEFKKEPVVQGKIIFIGDDLTEAGRWRKLLGDSSVINRGIAGDNTYGVLARLNEALTRKPEKIFLMVGINDFSRKIADEHVIENLFSAIIRIKKASPTSQIFVQSILPVNQTAKNFPAGYDKNDHVIVVNEQLQKYEKKLGYTYVDLYGQFLDNKSHLDIKFTPDGLHLNPAGYAHWLEILKSTKSLSIK